MHEVIQEMKELTNDVRLKINLDETNCMNTSKYEVKNMQPKTKEI